MAKKQKQNQALVVGEKINQGIKYLDRVTPDMLGNPSYIPNHLQSVIFPVIREGREKFDVLTELIETTDKSSEDHMNALREREEIATKWINIKNQVESFKEYTGELKNNLQNMSKGTKDENLYTNMLIGGAQADGVEIDEVGRLMFGARYGKDGTSWFALDDMMGAANGSPIITEPYGSKAFIWKMAEETKLNSNNKLDFDDKWVYTSIYNNLSDGGPQNTIGIAYADLAADNQSKSFAEMYEAGLNDKFYYTHPETGEAMPSDSEWMKDPNNADVLKEFLSKYITNVMKDIYGPVLNEETGQLKKTQSQLAEEIIKKYSK